MTQTTTVHQTRFQNLGYWHQLPGLWQHVDLSGDTPSQIGPQYPTREALVADTYRFAVERGFAEPDNATRMADLVYEVAAMECERVHAFNCDSKGHRLPVRERCLPCRARHLLSMIREA